ncbi:hypothetical protein TWF225_010083 [Orbilia oligospora]|nr:hypothetical protein TWF225_010083 [Orbilia oligospora]KAF3247500.1 hypothetical protein TWF128_008580 [Orbilia oligospora]KAF3250866.1 hypothetical protein TWF217_008477 [Orbilia oligospora]
MRPTSSQTFNSIPSLETHACTNLPHANASRKTARTTESSRIGDSAERLDETFGTQSTCSIGIAATTRRHLTDLRSIDEPGERKKKIPPTLFALAFLKSNPCRVAS